MPSPLVSVIVLRSAGGPAVERCLEHLRAQTHAAHEVAVVDGAAPCALPDVRGDLIALLAAAACPHPGWLAAAVGELEADATIGAVASLVFHAHYPLLLHSAGGSLTWRGDRIDCCADRPYELASLPRDVLYPSGGAALVARTVYDALAPLDVAVGPRFAAVELGLRVWALGRRVVLCPTAWIDRSASPSAAAADAIRRDGRDRIRTALKYFPAAHLVRWLARERRADGQRGAWAWNLRHLGSALRIRRRFPDAARRAWPLLAPTWQRLAPPSAGARVTPPDPARAAAMLHLDGESDAAQLGFGWYAADRDGARRFRPTAAEASAVVALPAAVTRCRIVWRGPRALETVTLEARPWGARQPAWRVDLSPPPTAWEQRRIPCRLGPGVYELQLRCAPPQHGVDGRPHGVEVATIDFDPSLIPSPGSLSELRSGGQAGGRA